MNSYDNDGDLLRQEFAGNLFNLANSGVAGPFSLNSSKPENPESNTTNNARGKEDTDRDR